MSDEYTSKFEGITSTAAGDKRVAEYARKAVIDNEGLMTEDAYFLNAKTGKPISHSKLGELGGAVELPSYPGKIIVLHNHPNSKSFSFKDFATINNNSEIEIMIAAGHDGTVHFIRVGNGKRLDLSDDKGIKQRENTWARLNKEYGDREALKKITNELGWIYYVK